MDTNPHADKIDIAGVAREAWAALLMALRFYSRLPTGGGPHLPPRLNRMAPLLPLASIVIGAGPALLLVGLASAGMPPLLASGLAVALAVMVSGAMAEDALADAADGLWGGSTLEGRLEIMKDSRHGTYGVCALVLLLVLRVAALASVLPLGPWAAAAMWLGAGILARSAALALPLLLPPARAEGASAAAGQLRPGRFWTGAGIATLLAGILTCPVAGLGSWLAALAAAAVVLALWIALCRNKVGGQTGDLIGAGQALAELLALIAMVWAF